MAMGGNWGAGRRIAVATLIAGTLDIAAAAILATIGGGTPAKMLRTVASGPFPEAKHWELAGSALGLAVHFAIMAVMAAAFVLAADRIALLKRRPVMAGTLYGVATWAVMNGLVLPARFGVPFPNPDPGQVAIQLFCHIVLVGIPIALVARR